MLHRTVGSGQHPGLQRVVVPQPADPRVVHVDAGIPCREDELVGIRDQHVVRRGHDEQRW